MLSISLLLEVNRRAGLTAGRPLMDDTRVQAAYCLDAPDEVQDGTEWYEDDDFSDCCGPVPRLIPLRGEA
jgi:hypothetical protein